MEENFIYCEIAEEQLGKTNKADSHNGDVSIDYLTSARSPQINTQSREYQREKVASLSWKQKVMLTVLSNGYRKIPQIHIRVIKTDNGFTYELVDGQQRITSIIPQSTPAYALGPEPRAPGQTYIDNIAPGSLRSNFDIGPTSTGIIAV